MIDFRYHLISIIAVLLALALGILVGSGFLGGPLLEDIEDRVKQVQAENEDLLDRAAALDRQVDDAEDFKQAVEPLVTEGRLTDRQAVIFVFDGTDGSVVDSIQRALSEAGASVAATITVGDRFLLGGTPERDQLALILRSTLTDPAELQAETGRLLGSRAAIVAQVPSGKESDAATTRLKALLTELEEAGFVSVRSEDPDVVVPSESMFVIAGGGPTEASWDVTILAETLAASLAELGAPVLAAEPSESVWEFAAQLRDSAETTDIISTVDHADSHAGRIALVLALDRMRFGLVGHYGSGPGAGELMPGPQSASE